MSDDTETRDRYQHYLELWDGIEEVADTVAGRALRAVTPVGGIVLALQVVGATASSLLSFVAVLTIGLIGLVQARGPSG